MRGEEGLRGQTRGSWLSVAELRENEGQEDKGAEIQSLDPAIENAEGLWLCLRSSRKVVCPGDRPGCLPAVFCWLLLAMQ